jgi:hypothetical protein
MSAEWGNRLLALARGALPFETGVTHVTTRNRNPGYVSEKPVVAPVTPVTSWKVPIPNEGKIDGVTSGVTLSDGADERAALVEIGAAVPRQWAEEFATLEAAAPNLGFSEADWRLLVDDGGRWTSQAIRAGWRAKDVFDVRPCPDFCVAKVGLVQLIAGGEVVKISEHNATLCSVGRATFIYDRRVNGAACTWHFDRFLVPRVPGRVR